MKFIKSPSKFNTGSLFRVQKVLISLGLSIVVFSKSGADLCSQIDQVAGQAVVTTRDNESFEKDGDSRASIPSYEKRQFLISMRSLGFRNSTFSKKEQQEILRALREDPSVLFLAPRRGGSSLAVQFALHFLKFPTNYSKTFRLEVVGGIAKNIVKQPEDVRRAFVRTTLSGQVIHPVYRPNNDSDLNYLKGARAVQELIGRSDFELGTVENELLIPFLFWIQKSDFSPAVEMNLTRLFTSAVESKFYPTSEVDNIQFEFTALFTLVLKNPAAVHSLMLAGFQFFEEVKDYVIEDLLLRRQGRLEDMEDTDLLKHFFVVDEHPFWPANVRSTQRSIERWRPKKRYLEVWADGYFDLFETPDSVTKFRFFALVQALGERDYLFGPVGRDGYELAGYILNRFDSRLNPGGYDQAPLALVDRVHGFLNLVGEYRERIKNIEFMVGRHIKVDEVALQRTSNRFRSGGGFFGDRVRANWLNFALNGWRPN